MEENAYGGEAKNNIGFNVRCAFELTFRGDERLIVESGKIRFEIADDATDAQIGKKLIELDTKHPKCVLGYLTRRLDPLTTHLCVRYLKEPDILVQLTGGSGEVYCA